MVSIESKQKILWLLGKNLLFNGTRQNVGRKRLDLKGFVLWSDYDGKVLESYSQDIGKIIAGIWMRAKEIEEDDF